ncbi:Phospholipid scramblase family protein [Sparassis crispa]|uniref:Phospholipid scramblase n=1 Tax=Sparassis crispa TaxID=139825 RepID=A0A401GIN3_9APHY|nr:Phospholipid scramblase family protein [Sparassis crispa]GBE82046.1 Phospholipid scramblase family protein [Sparassis crispa]
MFALGRGSRTLLSAARPADAVSSIFCRTYALSRFPERRPGTGRIRSEASLNDIRSRENSGRRGPINDELPTYDRSPLWEASKRAPVSDPEAGLKRLLLDNNQLVITRQFEMLNIFIGFEQSNRYVISNEREDTLGFIAEEPRGFLSTFSRQILRTHRPFRALVMDADGNPVLWLRRPFQFINSRMYVQRLKDLHEYTSQGEPVLDTFAEVQQRWHLWRRRYDLFLRDEKRRILSKDDLFKQVARVDEGFWAWDFTIQDSRGEEMATVNRRFRGFGRELFTDTGQYFVRFGPMPQDPDDPTPRAPSIVRDITLDERALVLALAVNIDFDYFSRHSGHGGTWFPMFDSFGGDA